MFKRANRELAKQSIGGDDFDPEAIDEVLAGVSSDESDDDSDMELTPSTQTSNNKRKYASHQDSDDSDDDSEDDSNQDEEDAVVSEEDDEETELVYNCDVCPEKRLTSEKHVAEHLQSKTHLRRAKIASKNDNIKNLSPKDLEKRNEQLEKAKLDRQEKIRQVKLT
ncbi:hypothetical protein BC941DRAFT_20300 [Chlamydoabsidia padenii]|nr:hypothetical protein BC941DRAFT_20300 [Chlamydoabsidia padenii]